MKKILIIINNFEDVSHNNHLSRLIDHLANEFEIIFSVLSEKGKLKNIFLSKKNIHFLKKKQVFNFLKKNHGVVILTKELRSEYFIFFRRVFLKKERHRHLAIRPSFGFLSKSIWESFKNILFLLSLFMVDLNIAVSETVAKRIKKIKFIKKAKVITIPNSLDENFTKQLERPIKIKKDNFNIIYSGFLEKRKNLSYAIKILAKIKPEFNFKIFGDGPEKKKLMKLVKNNNLEKKVFFFGHKKNIRQYLDGANIFLFTSKMEGLSLSLLEAMSRNLICIVSDIEENTELIKDGENGIVIPIDNEEESVKKINKALSMDFNDLKKIGHRAKETITKKYTDKKSFTKYANAIQQISQNV